MVGWLLDLYEDEIDGVKLWFITEDGERIMLRQKMTTAFYAHGKHEQLHRCCLFMKQQAGLLQLSRETRQDVFKPEPLCVLRIEMDNPVRQAKCFRLAKKEFPELSWYDADISVNVRHAARFGTFPMARCNVNFDEASSQITGIKVLNSRWDLQPLLPVLRILKLVPDHDPQKEEPTAICLTWEKHCQRIPLLEAEQVISQLNQACAEYDPDILQTQWGDNWLFPKLLEMQEDCGIPLQANRDLERGINWTKETSYFSYGQIIYREREAHLFGRCHIDTKNAMMWRDYKMDGALETSRVTAMPLEQAARVSPGSGISAMQMITALERDILVPEQKQQAEMGKNALELIQYDRGGMIYQPLSGLYANIAEIDFVSMYPAIIINGNISPETPLPDGLKPASNELGIVPLTLKPLYEKRVSIKEKLLHFPDKDTTIAKSYSARAAALKWLLVVCFGFLGYKNARFGRIESHEAVTRGGREALLAAKEVAEDMGFEVLHMFVDALWIRQRGCSRVCDFQPVLDEISRKTGMMIALDGVYRWVAFLPSRGNTERPVPNRYFGVFKDGSLKIRGIEARRNDMPPWVVETQLRALKCLANATDNRQLPEYLHKSFEIIKEALQDLNADRVPGSQLILTIRISRELEEYKAPTAAVRAARQLLTQTGKRTAPGQKVRFVYTLNQDKVLAWELPQPIKNEEIDKAKYRELMGRAAGTIFYPFGIDQKQMEEWAQGNLQFRLC